MAKVKDLLIMSRLGAVVPTSIGVWTQVTKLPNARSIASNPATGNMVISTFTDFRRSSDFGATWSSGVGSGNARSGAYINGSFVFMGHTTKEISTSSDNGVSFTTTTYTTPNVIYDRLVGGGPGNFGFAHPYTVTSLAKVTNVGGITDSTTTINAALSPYAFGNTGSYSNSQGVWFFAGTGGRYVTSADGTTWIQRDTGTGVNFRAMAETGSGRVVAIDDVERIYYNDNILNEAGWVQGADVSTAFGGTLWGTNSAIVASTDSDIIILYSQGQNADQFLISSDNGINWALGPDLGWSNERPDEIVYAGNNRFVVISDTGRVVVGDFN